MTSEEHNALFAAVRGEVTSATGASHAGELGDGLSTQLALRDGTTIAFAYWRLLKDGRPQVSSVEHGMQRGGPAIDAVGDLRAELLGRTCLRLHVDGATGDLLMAFSDGRELRAFRFRRLYEDWEVQLATGEAYWSNYVAFAGDE